MGASTRSVMLVARASQTTDFEKGSPRRPRALTKIKNAIYPAAGWRISYTSRSCPFAVGQSEREPGTSLPYNTA